MGSEVPAPFVVLILRLGHKKRAPLSPELLTLNLIPLVLQSET